MGNRIIQSVQKSVDIARMSMQDISPNILSPLCLHVSASYERMKCGKRIMNPQLEKMKKRVSAGICHCTKNVYAVS